MMSSRRSVCVSRRLTANPFQAKDLTPEDIVKYGGDISTYERAKRLDVAETAAGNPGMAGGLTGAGVGLGVGQALGGALNPNDQAMQQQLQQQQMLIAANDDADDAKPAKSRWAEIWSAAYAAANQRGDSRLP